jgi:hypothetical protein
MIESYSRDKHKVQTKSQTKPTSQSQQANKANKPTSQSQQLETQDVI